MLMTTRSATFSRRTTPANPRRPGEPPPGRPQSPAKPRAGKLSGMEFCSDLYSGIDAPEVIRDLQKMDSECVAFETDYKGKLAEHVARENGGRWLATAVKRYEAIDDSRPPRLLCRPRPRRRQRRPAISKFYGDVSERLTAASGAPAVLRLELNRVDDVVIDARCRRPRSGTTARGSRIRARTSRISSRIASSSCFTKSPKRLRRLEPAVRPDHLRPALQGRG